MTQRQNDEVTRYELNIAGSWSRSANREHLNKQSKTGRQGLDKQGKAGRAPHGTPGLSTGNQPHGVHLSAQ